jgi:hypothetical protein
MPTAKRKYKNKKIKRSSLALGVAVFVLMIFIVGLRYASYDYYSITRGKASVVSNFNLKEEKPAEKCPGCVRRLLDGVYVEPAKENSFPVAVIIENHPDARPQSGLSKANLVYEAEAEGGITRFLAFFAPSTQEQNLKKIGPIRSARPYFVDWARELSALLVHCGGSPAALAKISKEGVFNLNEFYNEDYFWRDNAISAPHNIFTSSDSINEYLEFKNAQKGRFLGWKFKNDKELKEDSEITSKITVDFQSPDFMVEWKYDKKGNDYIRYMGGKQHKDANGDEIRAKNVIIQYVKARVIDKELRLEMEHIGKGEALVCLDGRCERGQWRKNSDVSRTRFYHGNGDEFEFNAGTTWIEVVRPK